MRWVKYAMRWEEIKTREQWLALPESEKRAISREILESAFGLPVNEHRARTIESILDSLYYPENIKLRDQPL